MASSLINENLILNIPNEYYGAIIGENGANIKRIQEQYNVNITFPNRTTNQEDIVINGIDQQACLDTEQEILYLYDSHVSAIQTQEQAQLRDQLQREARRKEEEKRQHEREERPREKRKHTCSQGLRKQQRKQREKQRIEEHSRNQNAGVLVSARDSD